MIKIKAKKNDNLKNLSKKIIQYKNKLILQETKLFVVFLQAPL